MEKELYCGLEMEIIYFDREVVLTSIGKGCDGFDYGYCEEGSACDGDVTCDDICDD